MLYSRQLIIKRSASLSAHRKVMINTEVNNRQTSFSQYFKIGDSLTNLLLGIIVVILAGIAGFFLTRIIHISLKATNTHRKEITAASTVVRPLPHAPQTPQVYTVQKGDSLWSIADTQLHSGYRWTELAKVNNIDNPGMIFPGMKLTVPKTIVRSETLPTITNAGNGTFAKVLPNAPNLAAAQSIPSQQTYTVKRGDNLWNIAIMEYNSGFKWTDIAKANNLANPRIIHAGNVLIIPR